MKKILGVVLALMIMPAFGAEDLVQAIHGTVESVGSAGKTVVVKTAEGTKLTLEAGKSTAVFGFEGAESVATGGFRGVATGAEVVAHYSVKGVKYTALSIHKVGATGLRATEATVQSIDHAGKVMAVKTADGTVDTYKLADHATATAAKETGKGIATGVKVIVYSSETAGLKVAHFVRGI